MAKPFNYDQYFMNISANINALEGELKTLKDKLSKYGYVKEIVVSTEPNDCCEVLKQTVCHPKAYDPKTTENGDSFTDVVSNFTLPAGIQEPITSITQSEVEKKGDTPDQVILNVTQGEKTREIVFKVLGRKGPKGEDGAHGKNESDKYGKTDKSNGNTTIYLKDGTKALACTQTGMAVSMTAFSTSVTGVSLGATGMSVAVVGSDTSVIGVQTTLAGASTKGIGMATRATGWAGFGAALGLSTSFLGTIVAGILNKAGVVHGNHVPVHTKKAFSVAN